jgi:hypothetical protein
LHEHLDGLSGVRRNENGRSKQSAAHPRLARLVVVCDVGPRKAGDAEDIYNQLAAITKTGRLAEQLASVLSKFLPKKK